MIVNGQQVISNFELGSIVPENLWEFVGLSKEADKAGVNVGKLKYKLNEYTLPPVIIKCLKGMNINGVTKIISKNIEKLVPYLHNDLFKEDYIKPGDMVIIFLQLHDFETVSPIHITRYSKKSSQKCR